MAEDYDPSEEAYLTELLRDVGEWEEIQRKRDKKYSNIIPFGEGKKILEKKKEDGIKKIISNSFNH